MVLHTTLVQARQAMALPPEQQRLMYFTKKLETKGKEVRLDNNEKGIYYSEKDYTVMFNNRLFLKPHTAKGLSYDKETKKLKVWMGTFLNNLTHFKEAMKELGFEWVEQEHFDQWLTKGLLEKVFQGKITNPSQAAGYLVKRGGYQKGTSPELLRKFIKERQSYKQKLFSVSKVAKNLNHYIERSLPEYIKEFAKNNTEFGASPFGQEHILEDTIRQALALNEKIDFTWSPNRIKQVHEEWTKRLMEKELQFMEDDIVDYPCFPALPEGYSVLDTQKKVFEEGTRMSHCVYTNYWDRVKEGKYVVIHYSYRYNSNPVTIGIAIRRGTPYPNGVAVTWVAEIDQMFHRRNADVSEELEAQIKAQLAPVLDLIAFSANEYRKKVNQVSDTPSLVDTLELPDFNVNLQRARPAYPF